MKSTSHAWSVCLLAALGALAVYAPSARACEGDEVVRWLPERSWPGACETDVPTNGLIFLEGPARDAATPGGEGSLHVFVQRMVDGQAEETFEGTLSHPDPTSAVFKSDRALPANADFQLTAQRVSQNGTPLSAPFTSDFTTGDTSLSKPAFRAQPTIALEALDKELETCEADACGERNCVATGESVPTRFVRVAVPAIEGGLAQRPYTVSAELTASFTGGQAPVVASADEAAVQAGKRSFMVIEVPRLPADGEACVTVTAKDIAGNTVSSTPVCSKVEAALPSDDAAPTDKSQDATALQLARPALDDAEAEVGPADSAGGCAVGNRAGNAGSLGWLAIALTLSRLRSRKRAA